MYIDTLKFSRKLVAAGLDQQAAEGIADAIAEGIAEADVSTLATKADIAELRTATETSIAELRRATETDIAELRGATETSIAALKAELYRSLWLQGIAIVGLTVTLLKLLP